VLCGEFRGYSSFTRKFDSAARGALLEVETLMTISHSLGYVNAQDLQEQILQKIIEISKTINALINSLIHP
jgi:four helix bundle protein